MSAGMLAATSTPRLAVGRGEVLVTWFALTNLAMLALARATDAADLLLLGTVLLLLARRPLLLVDAWRSGGLPSRGLLALLGVYAVGLLVDPGMQGVRHLAGVVIAVVLYEHSRATAHRVVARPWVLGTCLGAGAVATVFVQSDAAGRNVASSVAVYYLLLAGLVWVSFDPGGWARRSLLTFVGVAAVGAGSGHRTMAALGTLGLVATAAQARWPRRRTQTVLLVVALAGITFLIMLNTGTDAFDVAAVNDASIEYSGRTFGSGRQRLWPVALELIGERPWLGFGSGTVIGDLVPTRLSTHSYYLQVLLQVGIVGLLPVVVALLGLLGRARLHPGAPVGLRPYTFSCLLLLVVHVSLDVFLTQNQIPVAVPVWLLVGYAVGMLDRDAASSA